MKKNRNKIDIEFDDIIGNPDYEHKLTEAEQDQVREYRENLYNKRSKEDKIKDILLGFRFSLIDYIENENPKEIIQLGQFLYELLDQIKVRKGAFAEYIEISPRNINKYFNGERKFAIEHLLKLEKLFNVHAETLLEIQLKNELIQMKKAHKGEYDNYKLEDLLSA
ncbi:helix-turn-helix transcriptional regulator [Fluviicola sp.]|uniref:helix-turn-helix transcriptional regulator n=1 Tax=Fluviicola sp. TaxID=1917219 RepID=UPI002619645D|nr:helix-turn-helix transcriptional regulator [Fluviicola sp.]